MMWGVKKDILGFILSRPGIGAVPGSIGGPSTGIAVESLRLLIARDAETS